MLVTNQTTQDYWFGPLHLPAGVGQTLTVDDTSETSLYLTDDAVAEAISSAYLAGRITVDSAAPPFPRPTASPALLYGDGAPEGSVYAAQGSVYMRRDGTQPSDALYLKTTLCELNTGWIGAGMPTIAPLAFFSWQGFTPGINVMGSITSDPTLAEAGGQYMFIPAPGTDEQATSLLHCSFDLVIDDPRDGGGTAWLAPFPSSSTLQPTGQGTIGHGLLTRYNVSGGVPSPPYVQYPFTIMADRTMIVAGTEPDSGFTPGTGLRPSYIRHDWPYEIGPGDTFTGWISTHSLLVFL